MRIDFKEVSYQYTTTAREERPALQKVSFGLERSECVGIAGPSGAGKTTLMQLFTGLLRPTSGNVLIDQDDLWQNRSLRRWIRGRIGLVFQFPETQLFADSIFDDVAFGPRNLGFSEREIATRVEDALRRVGLPPERFSALSPFEVSEGEKRRVAIAGVLAMDPEVLVLDEPTAGLDPHGAAAVQEILHDLKQRGVTVLWISHDLDLLFECVDRFFILKDGVLAFDGPKSSLRHDTQLLERTGLGVPRLFHLIRRLQQLGWDIPRDVYSFADLCASFEGTISPPAVSSRMATVPYHPCDS